jgi:hypothetical protein
MPFAPEGAHYSPQFENYTSKDTRCGAQFLIFAAFCTAKIWFLLNIG